LHPISSDLLLERPILEMGFFINIINLRKEKL